jgi:hypothetical protein
MDMPADELIAAPTRSHRTMLRIAERERPSPSRRG